MQPPYKSLSRPIRSVGAAVVSLIHHSSFIAESRVGRVVVSIDVFNKRYVCVYMVDVYRPVNIFSRAVESPRPRTHRGTPVQRGAPGARGRRRGRSSAAPTRRPPEGGTTTKINLPLQGRLRGPKTATTTIPTTTTGPIKRTATLFKQWPVRRLFCNTKQATY